MSKNLPLVTVICLCYNHENYIEACLESVKNQNYSNLQVIIMDDSSTDSSWEIIQNMGSKETFQDFKTLNLKTESNLGNTKAFNQALKHSKGKYIIDLSTDDILREDRIQEQVTYFEQLPSNFGVLYSNATYIDQYGNSLFEKYPKEAVLPEGNVYLDLITKYFIPSPTMMIKKAVMDELNGYDENLAFEDFDFWIRSSRNWFYGYQAETFTYIRRSNRSLSKGWYKPGDRQVHSNYLICRKISKINQNKLEELALNKRMKYEMRQATLTGNFKDSNRFYLLLKERNAVDWTSVFWRQLNKSKINLSRIFGIYKVITRKIKEQ